MRKTLILFLLMLMMAVGGFAQAKKKLTKFKKKPIPSKTKPVQGTNKSMNGAMTLGLKQQAVDGISGIKIEFVAMLGDSRCPEGVNCIWAGNGKVQISVSKNGTDGQTIELNTNLEPRSVSYQGYMITLTDLSPYPKSDGDASKAEYKASFTVTK